ncbi:alpha-amylase family glycosyl hydrolase [Undibacterium sp. TJN19]|uniref:alpha-amylase family glycosyl hydrolase n=1 Tax=Undibacterium sp. TJN19 TaxID=3413055 RepID=UPI003BF04954
MPASSNTDQLLQLVLAALPPDRHAGVRLRFDLHFPALCENLQKLYRDQFPGEADYAGFLAQLMQTLALAIVQRPAALQALDDSRSQQADWFTQNNMLGYCCYADRFAGDLRGVERRIPHLKELGVIYLHLLPFLKARAGDNDGGFAVADFDAVEERLGNMADLEQLAAALRQNHISLCSDFILNHVADDHPWALAAKNGDAAYRDYFHHYPDRSEPDLFETRLGQVFPQVAPGNFTYSNDMQAWVWTTFYPYQWDLNYRNPQVFASMAAALLQLANRGVEVFRLDSTAFLWKRAGSNCMNQPEAHWILQALRSLTDIAAPGILLKAEAIVQTAQLPAYLGSSSPVISECHLAYHSSLMAASWAAVAEQDTSLLRHVFAGTPALPAQTSWLTYVRCHDDIGWNVLRPEARIDASDEEQVQQRLAKIAQFFSGEGNSYARGASFQSSDPAAVHGTVGMTSALCGFASARHEHEHQHARQRLLLLYGLSFCFGGMPQIYMGDEFAQANDANYQQVAAQAADSRWLHRPHWDQELYSSRYAFQSNAGAVFNDLCLMLQARRQLPQLAAQAERRLLNSSHPAILAFERGTAEQPLLFIANFSAHAITLDLAELRHDQSGHQAWVNQLDQQTLSGNIELPAWSQRWLTKDLS